MEGDEEIELTLKLTRSEWCEMANAIASKATRIERGEYGEAEPGDEYDPKEWSKELRELYDKVTKVLGDMCIPF